jgi:predicted phage-related endonuclease
VGPKHADSWGPDGSEEIPDYVYAQVQHQAFAADLSCVYVAAFVSGFHPDWRLYPIPRDDKAIALIVERGTHFWTEHVAKKAPPNGADVAPMEVLKAMRRERSAVTLPDEAEQLLAEYELHSTAKKAAEKDAKESQRRLVALLGEHTDGLLPDGRRVTYRPQTRVTIDTSAIKAKFPEVAAECVKESTFPVFRVSATQGALL